jgi:hypothetical protein
MGYLVAGSLLGPVTGGRFCSSCSCHPNKPPARAVFSFLVPTLLFDDPPDLVWILSFLQKYSSDHPFLSLGSFLAHSKEEDGRAI